MVVLFFPNVYEICFKGESTIGSTSESLNPEVTWRTKIVLNYFQFEFEGICWTTLEKLNKEQLHKYARSTQRHQKHQIGQRSSCSKLFEKILEVVLTMSCIAADWICIPLTSKFLLNFCKKCSFVCSFRQSYVHDIKYNKVCSFCNFFKCRGELVCGA